MDQAPDGEEVVKAKLVKELGEYLEEAGMSEVQALPHARVPIVKLVEPDTGIACDICINNMLPLANTKLLRDYASVRRPKANNPGRGCKENKVWLAFPDRNLAFPENDFLAFPAFFEPPDRRSDGHDDGR
eukprot:1176554-Prorocentrum_minimum.AAC.1